MKVGETLKTKVKITWDLFFDNGSHVVVEQSQRIQNEKANIMKPIPAKTDIKADMHRLSVMIKEKEFSAIKNLYSRYIFPLKENAFLVVHQKSRNFSFDEDEIAAKILKDHHSDQAELLSPIFLLSIEFDWLILLPA